jgi:hypothetical protein
MQLREKSNRYAYQKLMDAEATKAAKESSGQFHGGGAKIRNLEIKI